MDYTANNYPSIDSQQQQQQLYYPQQPAVDPSMDFQHHDYTGTSHLFNRQKRHFNFENWFGAGGQLSYCPSESFHTFYSGSVPAAPADVQTSSGYYGNYSQPQQLAAASAYDCYNSSSQDHLEVKYQAAFVEALEGAAVAAEVDPLAQHHQQPEFQYEYETNYGNNEWTTSSSSSNPQYTAYPAGSDSFLQQSQDGQQLQHGQLLSDGSQTVGLPANYCFAACVFSSSSSATTTPPASVEPDPNLSILSAGNANAVGPGGYSPAGRHHFIESSYDYMPASILSDESMLLVQHQ